MASISQVSDTMSASLGRQRVFGEQTQQRLAQNSVFRPVLVARRTHGRSKCICAATAQQQQDMKVDLVRSLPAVRQPAPPPQAVAVQHSSCFLYRQRRLELGESLDEPLPSRYTSAERSWREDVRDVNTAAVSGIANAAKVTASVGKNVLSVAVPVGSWALRQGFRALKRDAGRSKQRARRRGDDGDRVEK